MRHYLVISAMCLGALIMFPMQSHADRVKQATSWYLKGSGYLKAGQYSKAISALGRAYRLLPRHPHFNCHRASFLNYQGQAYERMKKPYAAMRVYYKAAYKSRCRKTHSTHAARKYQRLYGRWMCSISFTTTPPKARIFKIVGSRDTQIGHTPMKKVFSPGTYKFKIRLYDHKTQYLNIKLRPGMHVKKVFTLVKGDDPVNRPEKVDVAPPPPMAANGKKQPAPVAGLSKKPKRIALGVNNSLNGGLGIGGATETDGVGLIDPSKRKKAGPPLYKQAWFWGVVGGVVVGATVVAIVIPKEQQLTVNQTTLFNP